MASGALGGWEKCALSGRKATPGSLTIVSGPGAEQR